MRTVKYGGDLQIGDFIAICYQYGFDFGWYCGEGKTTLQFFQYKWVERSFAHYNDAKKEPAYHNHKKANKEEFNKSWVGKTYIMDWHFRVMKIENPEAIFTEKRDLETYRESKEILEQIKFI
jgi:hypothetical protein